MGLYDRVCEIPTKPHEIAYEIVFHIYTITIAASLQNLILGKSLLCYIPIEMNKICSISYPHKNI